MQKILTLGIKEWLSGIGVGQHLEGSGIFTSADGINPFVDPFLNSADFGLLQPGKTAVDISGVADQNVVAFASRITGSSSGTLYALGISGDLYAINLATDGLSLQQALASVTSAQNMWISKESGGTEYLYYINNGINIGRWDLASTYTYNWVTTLQNTTIHPVHDWQKSHWIGDKNLISKVDETGTFIAGSLTLNADFTVTCLSDDDYRLVIGASSQTSSITLKSVVRVYFWDGASTLPEKMWDIPEPNIQWIKKVGEIFYANCGRSLYAFNYSTPPTKIIDLDANHSTSAGNYNAVDRLGDAVLWGSVDINMFGKLNARVPKAYTVPFIFALRAASVTALNASTKQGTIYVAGNNAKIVPCFVDA